MSDPAHEDASEIAVGMDGTAMFVLSLALMLLTGGLTFVLALHRVWCVARDAAAHVAVPPCAILVLGHSLDAAGLPSRHFRARLERSHVLATRWPASPVVVLGGPAGHGRRSEADAGCANLVARGVPRERIILESRSRHTLENLVSYRQHYRARFACTGAAPALVTSRFHLARSALIAEGLGIVHQPCVAEARWSPSPSLAGPLLFEALLIQWYLTGRAFARWTGNRRMLARIG